METKNNVIKVAKKCLIVSKVLYVSSFVAGLVFIALSIILPCTKAMKTMTIEETACLFGTLALYSFTFIGLLWNVEGIFKSVLQEKAPFGARVSRYLKKSAVFVVILSLAPALVGSTVLRLLSPETEMIFPVSIGGVMAGVVLFIFGVFFQYGQELQKNEDETL